MNPSAMLGVHLALCGKLPPINLHTIGPWRGGESRRPLPPVQFKPVDTNVIKELTRGR